MPSYRYFVELVDRLHKMRPEELTESSVLIGAAARIGDALRRVGEGGVAEVFLYFNVARKPHARIKEEMARFMGEIALHFVA